MIIRILLTVLFLLFACIACKREMIKEIQENPRLIKDNKFNFLTSAVPYTLFKIIVLYTITLIASIYFLNSLCTTKVLIKDYTYTEISVYENSTKKNQKIKFENDDEKITLSGISKTEVVEGPIQHIELYELRSDNKIVNMLLLNTLEKQVIIYGD